MKAREKTLLVAVVPQVDGGLRYVYAQDARHAVIARRILARDRAMLDYLPGLEGIEITVVDTFRAATPRA